MSAQEQTQLDSITDYVVGLERQMTELRSLLETPVEISTSTTDLKGDDEVEKLRTQNRKLEYRVKMLLRALEERDGNTQ
ncbi:hypothetical protein HDV00_002044 [Rhizophlyctis rosea]|nr:hypothetical protein HDV00_002044 [Rhizophlyctis rosea]